MSYFFINFQATFINILIKHIIITLLSGGNKVSASISNCRSISVSELFFIFFQAIYIIIIVIQLIVITLLSGGMNLPSLFPSVVLFPSLSSIYTAFHIITFLMKIFFINFQVTLIIILIKHNIITLLSGGINFPHLFRSDALFPSRVISITIYVPFIIILIQHNTYHLTEWRYKFPVSISNRCIISVTQPLHEYCLSLNPLPLELYLGRVSWYEATTLDL